MLEGQGDCKLRSKEKKVKMGQWGQQIRQVNLKMENVNLFIVL